MKKYVMLFAFTATIFAWLITAPSMVASSIPAAQAVKLEKGSLMSTVSCTGQIETDKTQAVCYGYSLKVESVYVKPGDTVKIGDRLMDIDKNATIDANQSPTIDESQISSSLQSNSSISSALGSDYGNILEQYYNQSSSSSSQSDSNSDSSASDVISFSSDSVPDCVYSPINGVITEVDAQDGYFTDPKTPLIIVSDLSSIKTSVEIDEKMAKDVRVGQTAYISGDGFNKTYKGCVESISPTASKTVTETGTKTVVDVDISLDNPDNDLLPNLSVDAEIVTSEDKNALAVPYESVRQDDNNKEYVYVYKNGRVLRQDVQTGQEFEDCIEVMNGLKIGEDIIINPPDSLKSGQKIRILPSETEVK